MMEGRTVPYPGYNTTGDQSPRPAARVRPEAEDFANRGRGSLDLFTSSPRRIDEPHKSPRCPSQDAKQNYDVGRNGTVSNLLYGKATPRADVSAVPRVKDEAQPIAVQHQGKQTAVLCTSYGNLQRESPAMPRVKQEASGTAEQHKGGRMNCLLHDPKRLPSSARSVPRVKSEASANADLDKGGQMNKTIHSYGSVSSRPEYVPRVKPEARETAEKGRGFTGTLFGKYGKLPLDNMPEPKVKGVGVENANLDKGGRMSRLMHEGRNLPQDPKPPPRAGSKAAKRILKNSRGQISQLFHEQGKRQVVSSPGTRGAQPLRVY